MMRILYATYPTPESFLENLELHGDTALLGVATRAEYRVDEQTILEIGYPGLPNRILVRAVAVESPLPDDPRKWFKFDPDEELQLDFLIAVASGRGNASVKRRHRRFPLRMEAHIKVDGDSDAERRAHTADMATGGIALATDEALPDGARVTVILDPGDGSDSIEIVGKVMWNREGDDETAEVGIQFERDGSEDMKRLRHLIRGVKLSGEIHRKM